MSGNLEQILTLSEAFRQAVEERYADDTGVKRQVYASLRPGEREKIHQQSEAALSATLQAQAAGVMSVRAIKKNISLIDTTAELFARVVPKEEVASLVPAELRKPENIRALRDAGATHLADLCAFTRLH